MYGTVLASMCSGSALARALPQLQKGQCKCRNGELLNQNGMSGQLSELSMQAVKAAGRGVWCKMRSFKVHRNNQQQDAQRSGRSSARQGFAGGHAQILKEHNT